MKSIVTAFAVLTVACASAANFYWCGAGEPNADGSRNWEDPANWLVNGTTVTETSYPGVSNTETGALSTGDQVWFTNKTNEEAIVKLSRALTVGYLYLHQAMTPVTLVGGTSTNDVLSLNNDLNISTVSVPITLDHIAIRRNNGNVTLGPNRALTLKNGANFYVNNFTFNSGASVSMSEGSWLRSNSFAPTGDDVGNTVTLSGGSTWLCAGGPSFPKKFALSLSEGSQFLAQTDAGTGFYNLNAYGGVNTISLSGGSLLRCNEFYIGYPGQVITLDDSTIDARGTCLIGNTLPGGGEINFKGAAPKFTVKGAACRVNNNNSGMNVPFVFRYFVPEGGYAEPPFQYLYNTTTECFGSWVNPTKLTQFVVDPTSPAATAGTLTDTALAYSISGFYRAAAKPNYTDITDTTGGILRFTDGAGVTDTTTTDGKKSKYIKASIGSGAPAPAPTIAKSVVGSVVAVAVNRKTFTATAIVLAKSTVAAKTVAVLYASGEGVADEAVAQMEVPGAGTYDLVWTAPTEMFERNYTHWIVLVDYDADGNELSSSTSGQTTVMSKDTTTYTWTGKGEAGVWVDPANWSGNQGDDCLHYPGTSGATASFPAGAKVTFVQDGTMTVGWVNANNADVELTFVRAEGLATNEVKWTFNSYNPNAARTKTILDGGCLYTPGVSLGDHAEIVLKNGANWYMNGDFWADNYGSVRLYDDSWLSCNQFGLGGGDSVISDSTLWTRSHDFVGRGKVGGSMRFEGTHPLWWHNNNGGYFYSNLANAGFRLDFLVPIDGFAAAPIRAVANQTYLMGNNGGSAGSSAISVNVLGESPANRVDDTITTPLIAWPKGINKTMIVEGALPDDGPGTDDEWVWSGEANPLTLGVTIKGSTHANELLVSGKPEFLAAGELSPSYGFTVVGASADCSAPEDYVTISDTKRAIVTGWKLYAVDAATHERTLVEKGEGNAYTYVNRDGLWHELEWQWRVEYLITVENDGNGTAQAESAWVETGKKARLSVEPADGYAFFKWTGDVDLQRDKTENLFFTVRNRPYALTANFLPTVRFDGAGELADFVAANAGKAILLPDGLYEVTKQIAVPNGTIVRGMNAGANAIVKSTVKFGTDVNAPCSVFKLAYADACLQNITITTDADRESSARDASNNLYKEGRARGVWIEGAGLVDGCVISNCVPHYNGKGGAVYLNAGGVVRNTFVHNCRVYSSGGNDAKASAFYLEKGGLVETCEIRDCGLPYNASSSATVALSGGTVRNTLIADSTQGHTAGDGRSFGLYVVPTVNYTCTIENCTIVGNYQLASSLPGVFFWDCNGTSQRVIFRNNIIWNNLNSLGVSNWQKRSASVNIEESHNCTTPTMGGEGDITEDPAFTDMAGKDYTLTYSGAVDSALELDWMGSVLSLDGKERVIGAAPDMGCYEYEPNGLVCGFTAETTGALGKDTITFRASVLGDTDGIVYTWTLVDQDGVETTKSGDDLATLAIEMPVGRYTVTLGVRNGAGDEGSVTKPNIAEVFPSDVYVSTTGANIYPYDSYANGAASVDTALGCAADGTVIHLDDGAYYEADTLAITKAVKLVSKSGPESTSVFAAAQTSGSPMIMLANPDAVISGIAIDGLDSAGKSRNQWSGVVLAAAGGTITNCIVRNNTTVSISVAGSGCRMEGGTIVDSVFSNNWTQCSGGAGFKGGALAISGANAVVQRCRIVGNKISTGSPSFGGGFYVSAGTVLNTFVADNFVQGSGGGIAVEGSGVVRNCTVVRNEAMTAAGGIWQNGGTVADCIAWNNTANGSQQDADDPGFADANNGDFHLTGASAAVDAVADATGLGEFDLDLLPRVSGKAADAGCYEYDQSQFSVGINYEKLSEFAPGKVRFAAILTPETAQLDEEQTWWTFDGTEPSADNYAAKGAVVEREFAPGYVTARFKTVYEGETYPIDKVEWFTYYGQDVYVNLENANPVYPFASRETAATNYEEAILCVQANATLHLAAGTYPITKTQNLSVPMTIVSDEGAAKTFFDQYAKKEWSTPQAFVISNPGVTVDGITFKDALSWNGGGAISMSAGLVKNCVFQNCKVYHGSKASAVYMSGGTVVDCVCDGCGGSSYNSRASNSGTVFYVGGANTLLDRCLVLNTSTRQKAGANLYIHAGGAIHVENGGTVRNTVIAGSVQEDNGGFILWQNAKVENCTVYMNSSTNQPGCAAGIAISNATAKVVNTIVYGNTTKGSAAEIGGVSGYADCFDHCLIGVDPQLRGKGKWAYRPTSASPCLDAGLTLDWMTEALDLYGQPRVQGQGADKKPDIGAAEYRPSGLRLWVK